MQTRPIEKECFTCHRIVELHPETFELEGVEIVLDEMSYCPVCGDAQCSGCSGECGIGEKQCRCTVNEAVAALERTL